MRNVGCTSINIYHSVISIRDSKEILMEHQRKEVTKVKEVKMHNQLKGLPLFIIHLKSWKLFLLGNLMWPSKSPIHLLHLWICRIKQLLCQEKGNQIEIYGLLMINTRCMRNIHQATVSIFTNVLSIKIDRSTYWFSHRFSISVLACRRFLEKKLDREIFFFHFPFSVFFLNQTATKT